MIDDYDVMIEYRNKNLEKTGERRYLLTEYASMIEGNIKRSIFDIENAFNLAHKEKEYDVKEDPEFIHVRKILLNAANAIGRLPINIRCNGEYINDNSLASFIANKFKT